MSTEALLKLLIGIASAGTTVAVAVLAFVWRASRGWALLGAAVDRLAERVKELGQRFDVLDGRMDSHEGWRREHQATSNAQAETLDRLERASR